MRKIIVQEMLSVDGFFCGPNGEIDWHNVDAEFNEMAIAFLDTVDTLVFGRVTYDLMASWWPKADAMKDDPIVAGKMNALAKFVYSQTVQDAEWNNTTMHGAIDAEEIRRMKAMPGKDIAIFGSGTIVAAFARLGLIDEYRFIIAPVVLGAGKDLFATAPRRYGLKLLEAKAFASGNVLTRYAPAASAQ